MLLVTPRGFGGRTLKLLLGCHYTVASPDFPVLRFAMMTLSTTRTWLRELAELTAKQACKDFGRKSKLLYRASRTGGKATPGANSHRCKG